MKTLESRTLGVSVNESGTESLGRKDRVQGRSHGVWDGVCVGSKRGRRGETGTGVGGAGQTGGVPRPPPQEVRVVTETGREGEDPGVLCQGEGSALQRRTPKQKDVKDVVYLKDTKRT